MKLFCIILFCISCFYSNAQSTISKSNINGIEKINENANGISFISFKSYSTYISTDAVSIIKKIYLLNQDFDLVSIRNEKDNLGFEHQRFQILYKQYLIDDAIIIVHSLNQKIKSISGSFNAAKINSSTTSINFSESQSLQKALSLIQATEYRWQSDFWEKHLKETSNNAYATWFPKGELMFVPATGNYNRDDYKLAWRFDIYSSVPVNREYIYVDAANGNILFTESRLCEANVPGTAITAYSGTQTIITDSYNGEYRLRETTRGLGVETYDLQSQANTNIAIDFTDNDNTWNNVNASLDQYATDAHWGAEKTYDFYMDKFNRNSIDNNGFKLKCYVHLDVNYFNAFFDGEGANFGDGSNGATPLTSLDVVGHELSHGLTQFTAGLNYQDESGALNESFSDIFGTAIEFYASPSGGNYLIGDQIGQIIRSMQNPNQYNNPDTYQGTAWYNGANDNGGVHTNSGVQNFWWYLLINGGTGINDNGDSYNVTGLDLDKATKIAYRTLVYYLFPTSQYADARLAATQAAVDLYGACSTEVASVVNAWHAVGVGDAYLPITIADFKSFNTQFCNTPASVQFINQSFNAGNFIWDFGDGDTSSMSNPIHVYNELGIFNVKLFASGGACGEDSMIKNNFILVDTLLPCLTSMPATGTSTVTTCDGILFDSGGPNQNYEDQHDVSITIAPIASTGLVLQFEEFTLEAGYDFLYIYNGADTSAPLIGIYTGGGLPEGGLVIPANGSVTIRLTSDEALNQSGFKMKWHCLTDIPYASFDADIKQSCSGIIHFTDLSLSNPNAWQWNFGDNSTSPNQNPVHQYQTDGVYSVSLIVSNTFGSDTLLQTDFIIVDKPGGPIADNESSCLPNAITLHVSPSSSNSILHWYQNATGGNPIYSDTLFTTPILSASTTYYVDEQIDYPILSGGKPDNSGGGGYYTNNTDRYLIFDVLTPVKLKSVKVYANSDANRTIELRNQSGAVLQQITVFITSGAQTIDINFDLMVGTNFQLGIAGPADLYRNDGAANFPYEVPGVLSITGSNANQPGFYYYFYDWKLQLPSCVSERTPVQATIGVASLHILPANNILLCAGNDLQLSTDNGITFNWSTGSNNSIINVNATGTYSVSIVDDNGCSGSDSTVVDVVAVPVAAFSFFNFSGSFTFTNLSSNATTYVWDFGDDSLISNETNPVHIYSGEGIYKVKLIASNGACTDTTSKTIIVTGINEMNFSQVKIYPNPATDFLMIDFATNHEKIELTITDVVGRKLISKHFGNQEKSAQINISLLAAGTYIIHINDQVNKFLKL